MTAWLITGVACAALAAIGGALDRLMLRRQKVELYERLVNLWLWIDATPLPGLVEGAASYARLRIRNLLPSLSEGSGNRARAVVMLLLATFSATSIASLLGGAIEPDRAGVLVRPGLPGWPLYLVNAPLDIATVWATYHAMTLVKAAHPLRSLGVVAANLLLALAFATATLVGLLASKALLAPYRELTFVEGSPFLMRERVIVSSITIISSEERADTIPGSSRFDIVQGPEGLDLGTLVETSIVSLYDGLTLRLGDDPSRYQRTYQYVIRAELPPTSPIAPFVGTIPLTAEVRAGWDDVLMAATSLIPTALFLVVLMVLTISHVVMRAARWSTLHILERVTEDDPSVDPARFSPGTLTGVLLGVLAIVARAIADIMEALSA